MAFIIANIFSLEDTVEAVQNLYPDNEVYGEKADDDILIYVAGVNPVRQKLELHGEPLDMVPLMPWNHPLDKPLREKFKRHLQAELDAEAEKLDSAPLPWNQPLDKPLRENFKRHLQADMDAELRIIDGPSELKRSVAVSHKDVWGTEDGSPSP